MDLIGLKKLRILFVCTGNYYRSRFAEAYFNSRADELNSNATAFSRGLKIHLAEPGISPHTKNKLNLMGIPLHYTSKERRALTESDLKSASITFCLYEKEHRPMFFEQFPEYAEEVRYWDFPDLDEANPDFILNAIQRKINHLIHIIKIDS